MGGIKHPNMGGLFFAIPTLPQYLSISWDHHLLWDFFLAARWGNRTLKCRIRPHLWQISLSAISMEFSRIVLADWNSFSFGQDRGCSMKQL